MVVWGVCLEIISFSQKITLKMNQFFNVNVMQTSYVWTFATN